MRPERTCEVCNCHNRIHGGCTERGHAEGCHGGHTMYFCVCECCPCDGERDDAAWEMMVAQRRRDALADEADTIGERLGR